MTTLATLKARISSDLRGRTGFTDQIASAIQDAIKQWEGERFWFNEKRFRLDTVAGTEEYSIPADLTNTDASALSTGEDLLELDDVKILDDNEIYQLQQRSEQWLNNWQAPASQYTGTPDYYGVFANKIRIGPIPDAVYQITISGLAKLATVSDDADTNAWTNEAEFLIRHQALANLYRFPLRDGDGFAMANGAIADAVSALKRKTGSKLNRGRIRAWGYV